MRQSKLSFAAKNMRKFWGYTSESIIVQRVHMNRKFGKPCAKQKKTKGRKKEKLEQINNELFAICQGIGTAV